MTRPPPKSPLFPNPPLSQSNPADPATTRNLASVSAARLAQSATSEVEILPQGDPRSEEHTSELQSLRHLVCRLLLEKKKQKDNRHLGSRVGWLSTWCDRTGA